MRLVFGPYTPDLADHGHNGLTVCENLLPVANGYKPVGAVQVISDPLTGWSGGGSFITDAGSSQVIGGNAAGLWRLNQRAWSSLTAVTAGRWRFAQNGSIVVCVHGGAPVAFDLSDSTAGALGGSPPNSAYVATVRDFTLLAGNPSDVRTVTWSSFGNPESYTGNQAGSQTFPDGGAITGLVGGEFGLIFQAGAINRYDYVGGQGTWQRTVIDDEIGCIEAGSLVQVGFMTFFLSERGFMRCDGTATVPIGDEVIDRTFREINKRERLRFIYAAVDPRSSVVMWAIDDRIYAYNYMLNRWSELAIDCRGIVSSLSSYTLVDELTGLVDTETRLVDDPTFVGGVPTVYVVTPEGALGTLTGSNLAARIKTAMAEMVPGQRVRPQKVQPISDVVGDVTITVDARQRLGDPENLRTASTMRTSGRMPIRANGRFVSFETAVAAGADYSFVQGLEVEVGLGGNR